MKEQLLVPPDSAECPKPRTWESFLASEVPGVTARPAKSLAAIGVRTAKQLYEEVELGTDLTELKYIGEKTVTKIIEGIEELREGVLLTQRLREAAAKEA